MERMEPIRGKLLAGERMLLEDVEGCLGSRIQANGHRAWHGFFELATDRIKQIRSGGPYRLVLEDGRAADLYLVIMPGAVPGLSLVEFSVSGVSDDWKPRKILV